MVTESVYHMQHCIRFFVIVCLSLYVYLHKILLVYIVKGFCLYSADVQLITYADRIKIVSGCEIII